MIKFVTLFSGSSGNSAFIGTDHVKLLLDAGMPAKSIERELRAVGEAPEELDAVLVTHEHIDHVRGVGVLARRYGIKVVGNERTLRAMLRDTGEIPEAQFMPFGESGGGSFALGDLEIEAFPIPHDAASPVGYSFSSKHRKLTAATDIGHVTPELRDYCLGSQAVLIEANHDLYMLEHGPYPRSLIARIKGSRGHLSNESCAGFIEDLLAGGTRAFVLGHLSQENNVPDLAYRTVEQALAASGAHIVDYGDTVPPELFGAGGRNVAGVDNSALGTDNSVALLVAPRSSHGKVILL